jgi:hypothetical protein
VNLNHFSCFYPFSCPGKLRIRSGVAALRASMPRNKYLSLFLAGIFVVFSSIQAGLGFILRQFDTNQYWLYMLRGDPCKFSKYLYICSESDKLVFHEDISEAIEYRRKNYGQKIGIDYL